jgi:hypothetical protein
MRMEATEVYFKVQSQNLPGRTQEYHVNSQLKLSVPGPRFETGTTRIQLYPFTANQSALRDDILSFTLTQISQFRIKDQVIKFFYGPAAIVQWVNVVLFLDIQTC